MSKQSYSQSNTEGKNVASTPEEVPPMPHFTNIDNCNKKQKKDTISSSSYAEPTSPVVLKIEEEAGEYEERKFV